MAPTRLPTAMNTVPVSWLSLIMYGLSLFGGTVTEGMEYSSLVEELEVLVEVVAEGMASLLALEVAEGIESLLELPELELDFEVELEDEVEDELVVVVVTEGMSSLLTW